MPEQHPSSPRIPGRRLRAPLAAAAAAFTTKYSTDQVLLDAGALLIMALTILVFLVLQRHFVKALLQGSVKG